MKVITWNVRGLNAPKKQKILVHLMRRVEVDIMMLQEMKLGMEKIKRKLGGWEVVCEPSVGASVGLDILWNPRKVNFNRLGGGKYWIGGKVKILNEALEFVLINIYGPVSLNEKVCVWEEIAKFFQLNCRQTFIVGEILMLLYMRIIFFGVWE